VPQFVLSFVLFYQSSYVAQPWHYFLIYQMVNILVVLHNTFTLRKTMWVNDVSCKLATKFIWCMAIC
jgi:choline transport protein